MKVLFNPSGTGIHKGKLKVRVDLYPEPTDKTFLIHNVEHFDSDDKSLGVWTNPCLCSFVTVPENITKEDLKDYLENVLFTPDNVATLDSFEIGHPLKPTGHLVSAFMRKIPRMTDQKVQPKDFVALISSVNQRLANLSLPLSSDGEVTPIEPQSIDIGADAINRGGNFGFDSISVAIGKENPANATGVLDTIEIWCSTTIEDDCIVGTCEEVDTDKFTTRDYHEIGEVVAGSKQTFSPVEIDVETGDYLGIGASTGSVERDTSGDGYWIKTFTTIPLTSEAMIFYADRTISVHATGEEAGAGVSNELQAIWNTRAVVFDTSQLVYNVRAIVSDTAQLVWGIRTVVSDTLQAVWNIKATVSGAIQFIWSILSLFTSISLSLSLRQRTLALTLSRRNTTLHLRRRSTILTCRNRLSR